MNIDCGEIGIAGFYTFELNGVPVFEVPSKNLITDFGWSRLASLSESLTNTTVVQVGSGNTPPTTSDTALGSLLAQKTGANSASIGTGTDGTGAYSFSRVAYAFSQGAVVGNVAEVGFKVLTGDVSLTSRSLVKDGLGNPAVIVVTAIDQLTVNYELRYYRAPLDLTSTVTVATVSTTYVLRTASAVGGTASGSGNIGGLHPTRLPLCRHYGSGSTFGAVGTDPTGPSTDVSGITTTAVGTTVNPTNIIKTFTTSVIGTTAGNIAGGVNSFLFSLGGPEDSLGGYGAIKVSFSPAIPKDSTKTLTYSFSFTFSRL